MTRRGLAAVLALSLVIACAGRGGRKRTRSPSAMSPAPAAVEVAGPATGPADADASPTTVGSYMDRQRQDLEQVLAREDRVEREGETLRVALSSDVLFDPGSGRLQLGAHEKLAEVARVLNQYPRTRLDLIGHTDARGTERANQRLSERWAKVIRDVLVREGVDPGRMTIRGAGDARPVATNDTAAGRAMNRRVEIVSCPEDGLAADGRAPERGADAAPENEP